MKNAFQGTISGAGYGYVYVMSYPNSNKVKIGHSLNPTTRAADIGGTLAPETPTVEAYFWCAERREAVEREAHRIAADSRHNGEWFTLSIGQAMTTIQQAASRVGVSAQLAFDRNQWEAQAAAERAEKLEREQARDARTRAAAEQEAAALSKEQIGQLIHGRRPSVRRGSEPVRYDVLQAEWLKKAEAERQRAMEQERRKAEIIAQSQTMRGVMKSYMSLTQAGLGLLTIAFLFGGIANLIGNNDAWVGSILFAGGCQLLAWFDRKEKLQQQLGETA